MFKIRGWEVREEEKREFEGVREKKEGGNTECVISRNEGSRGRR